MKRPLPHWRALFVVLGMAACLPTPDDSLWRAARAGPPSSDVNEAAPRPQRPRMQSLPVEPREGAVPSQRALVDARATFRQRYGDPTSRARTSSAALLLAEALIKEAGGESDTAVKWVILEEARELAISAGSPAVISRTVRAASAEFDFDALTVEYRALLEIPLRALDRGRASDLATAATTVATQAETERRFDIAVLAQGLAIRAWQRAGDLQSARSATERLDRLELAGRSATLRTP